MLDDILLGTAGAAIGAALGSFIVTLVIRWPDVASIVSGRSRCDACGTPVPVRSLIPVVSYFGQLGRARCCGAPIDPLHPIGEMLAASIGAASILLLGPQGWPAAMFGWLLLALALLDLRYFILPNLLVAALAIAGIACSAFYPEPPLADRLIGGACGYGVLELIRLGYRRVRHREGLGGGDPKLFGAIGLWVGWQPLPLILLSAALLGLAAAAVMYLSGRTITATRRMPLGTLMAVVSWPFWLWVSLAGRV